MSRERRMLAAVLEPLNIFGLHPNQTLSAAATNPIFVANCAVRALFAVLTVYMIAIDFGDPETIIRGLESLSGLSEAALKLLPLLLFKRSLRRLLVDLDRFWAAVDYETVDKFAAAYKYVCCFLFATLVLVSQYKQEFLLRCHVPDFPYAKNILVALQSLNFCFDTCLIIVMDLYFFETCYFIKKQFDLLLGRLKDISECRNSAEVRTEVQKWKIHHDFLTRYTASIAKVYELYFLLKFVLYIVLFCTFIVVKPGHSGSYFEPICREVLLANQMILMYLLVAKVTDTAEEIADAVYSTNWYRWPLDVQKDLIVTIQRAQTTPKFTAFGIVTINRTTITKVFQKTYSFYTIAKSVMDLKQAENS